MNYQQFIAAHGITMSAEWVDSNPNMHADNMDHWRVVLRIGRRSMTTYYSMGYGHNGNTPKLGEVLECLASDASSVYWSSDFAEWAGELGYDADSITAFKTWQTVNRQTKRLQQFLGIDLFDTLLNDVTDCVS